MKTTIAGTKDPQLVNPDWERVTNPDIEGVMLKEVRNVVTDSGYLTEAIRADWNLDPRGIGQVFQRVFLPGAVSAWHVHLRTTDRLFCAWGTIKAVVYDDRTDSPSFGKAATFHFGVQRPATLIVPPGVWHGVRVLGNASALVLNIVDHAYDYEDPDHYRIPADSQEIPVRI